MTTWIDAIIFMVTAVGLGLFLGLGISYCIYVTLYDSRSLKRFLEEGKE